MAETVTPMMKQYQDAKQACPDALLLFRMGDFYELFHDDAKMAAQTLEPRPDQPREGRERASPWPAFRTTSWKATWAS